MIEKKEIFKIMKEKPTKIINSNSNNKIRFKKKKNLSNKVSNLSNKSKRKMKMILMD